LWVVFVQCNCLWKHINIFFHWPLLCIYHIFIKCTNTSAHHHLNDNNESYLSWNRLPVQILRMTLRRAYRI
jgi:hypothetical protein